MQVTEIVVNAARTFNHPHESYSNLRPGVTLKATLSEGDEEDACVKALQAKAEKLVEDHKRLLIETINQVYELSQADEKIADIEQSMLEAQNRLERLREYRKQLPETFGLFDEERAKAAEA